MAKNKGAKKEWPSFRYGPKGEAQIFHRQEDVPQGWKDHPTPAKGSTDDLSKPSSAPELLDKVAKLETEVVRLNAEIEELRSRANRDSEIERARQMDPRMDMPPMPDIQPVSSPPKSDEKADSGDEGEKEKSTDSKAASTVRKLGGAAKAAATGKGKGKSAEKTEPKPFTPQDDSITLDESRKEALSVLRSNGVEIDDNATDGEIEAALNSLED